MKGLWISQVYSYQSSATFSKILLRMPTLAFRMVVREGPKPMLTSRSAEKDQRIVCSQCGDRSQAHIAIETTVNERVAHHAWRSLFAVAKGQKEDTRM